MKRSICTLLFALAAIFTVAAEAQASALFPPTAVYEDHFVDVQSSDWFYDNVASLYSLGLTNGKGDTSIFAPSSDMSVAEALTIAARIRSLYEFGAAEAGANLFRADGAAWYTPYVTYLQSCGIITSEFDDRLHLTASRAEMSHILAGALPVELFEAINDEVVTTGYSTRKFISDVNDYTPYQQDILTLYRWGILGGVDDRGTFLPEAGIRRSEVAAMVTRLVDSDLRLTLNWQVEEKEYFSLTDIVIDGVAHSAPDPSDKRAVDETVRYMLARGERSISLKYEPPLSEDKAAAIMNAFLDAVRRYPEQTYNKISISYYPQSGDISVTFSSSLYDTNVIESFREQIFYAALTVQEELYAAGLITDSMTQLEKARVYFDWLCSNCAYDFNCHSDSLSHSAYGVFSDQLAVCDGYTAAYNLLLGLEGIECYAIDLESADHMWTIATLDGVTYHIDPTWGDQTNTTNHYYFAMTEEDSMARFH